MRSIKDKRGFTLVELIVVLVILAILAAVLIPSLIGYIDKAKQRAVIAEARDVWTASQAALSECYALYPESFAESCKFKSTIGGVNMTKLGRISNGALGALQKNPKDPTEAGVSAVRPCLPLLAVFSFSHSIAHCARPGQSSGIRFFCPFFDVSLHFLDISHNSL